MRLSVALLATLVAKAHGQQNCHSISTAASDEWCQKNCNFTPPNCPATMCKCGSGPAPAPIPKPVWPDPPSPPPKPPPIPGPESGCTADQIKGHCDKCADSKCTACRAGYGLNSDGTCIAACLLPGYTKPQPPQEPGVYNGIQWPDECIDGTEEHFFGIGDWGGLQPGVPAPNVHGKRIETPVIDGHGQALVAAVMNARADTSKPRFVVNVGDNFYWGGLDNQGAPNWWAEHCGSFVGNQDKTCSHYRFKQFFEDIYTSPGLLNAPWFSVLGNHDFGGYSYETGWDGQIFYTWCPTAQGGGFNRWRMPGFYWRQKVQFRDFSVDLFMMDGNVNDVKPGDLNHNICQRTHTQSYFDGTCNVPNATMRNEHDCSDYLKKVWDDGVEWLKGGLAASDAEWQIVVTHYPASYFRQTWHDIEPLGLDLIITGHTHEQHLYMPGAWDNPMKDFSVPWLITGGGGGVTSEGTPHEDGNDDEYGFVDFTINKDELTIEMFSHGGTEHKSIMRKSGKITPRKISTDAEKVFI